VTPSAAIPDALFERFLSMNEAVFSPARILIAPPKQYHPQAGTVYLLAQFLPNETTTRYVSRSKEQHQGFLQVTVLGPPDEGDIPLRDIAGEVIDFFDKDTAIRGDGVTVKIIRKPWAGPTLKDGAWLRVPVSIPYNCMA
jgi:Bacteriophage related domain of unknown function